MGCLVTFSDRSARKIYSALGPPATPQPYLSSRLLNHQIKYVMHKLHRELTLLVLEDLERCLRSRTKDSWGPSFCAILLLCLCIEGLQSAADVMVVCEIMEKGESEASFTRDQSYQACADLDEYPFRQSQKLFHDIYRTHKEDGIVRKGCGEKGFNPLRNASEATRMDLDQCRGDGTHSLRGCVR
jgi:hypothetical protein